MPTGKTITAREAGIFLPGDRVKERGTGHWANVIVPSSDAMCERSGDTDIFVRWFDGSESWVKQDRLEYR
jgi:hypothetical protein